MDNVGLTIDTGHALAGYENMAEVTCGAMRRKKLMHMHFNDNYRYWDDDMITGSIHTTEYLELFYWLKRLNYTGWLSVDQYPYRENSQLAVEQSIKWMMAFEKAVEGLDEGKVKEIFDNQDAVLSSDLMRELIFGKSL